MPRDFPSGPRWLCELLVVVSALVTGVALQMDWFSRRWDPTRGSLLDYAYSDAWTNRQMPFRLWLAPIVVLAAFWCIRALLRLVVARVPATREIAGAYRERDGWVYTIFLLTLLGAFGIHVDPFALFLLFALGQGILIWKLSPRLRRSRVYGKLDDNRIVMILFLASGFAALIYQVAWQRSLLQSFGVNIESVTVIVSVFMFGLGLGSLLGGMLSKSFPRRLLHLFVGCELIIGTFGLFSLALIDGVGRATLDRSLAVVAGATFGLLCLPTVFMGATLPILVTYLHRSYRSVGTSVSLLYFINTLGSAIASFLCVNLLFRYLGLEGVVRIAVLFNLGVAFFGYRLFLRPGRGRARAAERPPEAETAPPVSTATGGSARYGWILLASFTVGFISLSLEILWMRLLSFATGSRATVFGNLVGCYLVGIALGSLLAKKRCERDRRTLPAAMAGFLLGAAGLFFLVVPVGAEIMTWIGAGAVPLFYVGAGGVALLTGAVFPMLTHYAITRPRAVGLPVSHIYAANIVGATTGPLLTGFYLLEWFSLERNILYFALLTLAVGLVLAMAARRSHPVPRRWVAGAAVVAVVGVAGYPLLYGRLLEKLFFKYEYRSRPSFSRTVQNRSGIINVIPEAEGGDTVLGGGVFDGRFNTGLTLDLNKIRRAYMFAALHPHPRRVLEIGLSTASWARVMLNHPAVEELHVVEINPGYLEIVQPCPESRSVLDDPRVTIHIDDGRRWIRRHPEERFDFIIMNATFYWRSQANNLLSREFLSMCRRRLRPGGVVYYNTTSSRDAFYTAARVFPHVVKYESFVAASDSPFTEGFGNKLNRLAGFSYEGEPILEWENGRLRGLLETMARTETRNRRDELLELDSVAQLITDNNLASEYKTGRKTFAPPRAWLPVLARRLGDPPPEEREARR